MNPSDVRAAPKPFVFVLMPFKKSFDDAYSTIKAIANEVGAYAERVDEQQYREDMLDRIVNQIAKADVIVADMTGRNANVSYEVGYAHALNKILIPLTRDADDIPFDLKHRPHVVYDNMTELAERLRPWLAWSIKEAAKGGTRPVVCPVEVHINHVRIAQLGAEPYTIVQDTSRHVPSPLMVQLKNVSGASVKEPVTHMYLYLEPGAAVVPLDVPEGATSAMIGRPIYIHPRPVVEGLTHQYQLATTPIRLPAFAWGTALVNLLAMATVQGPHYVPAMLEVLIAESAFQFRFTIVYINGLKGPPPA